MKPLAKIKPETVDNWIRASNYAVLAAMTSERAQQAMSKLKTAQTEERNETRERIRDEH